PEVIISCADMMGSATTPMAMLILGSSLAQMRPREIFGDWRAYIITTLRLIVFPLATWLIMSLFFPADSMLLQVVVLLAAMPSATNATMMAIEFGGDQSVAARCIFLTTILSMITIPLLSSILFT
ncbi:MAG: AEC family transporter, partial [Sporomusa sp.]